MKRKIINGVLLLALVVSSVSTFVSCKDYDEDIYVDLRGRLDREATLRETLESQMTILQTTIKNMQTQIELLEKSKCGCDLSKFLTEEDLKGFLTADDLKGYVLQDQLTALIGRIADLETAKSLLENRIKAIEDRLNNINNSGMTLEQKIVALDQAISEAKATADEAKAKAEDAQTKAQEALTKAQEALAKAEEALAKACNCTPGTSGSDYDDTEVRNLIKNLTAAVNTLQQTVRGLQTTNNNLQQTVSGLQTTVNNLTQRMQAVEGVAANALNKANEAFDKATAIAADVATIKGQITDIQTWINSHGSHGEGSSYDDTAIKALINTLNGKVNDLTTRVETIENNYATKDQVAAAKALADKANDAIASLRDSIKNGNIVTIGQLRDSLNNYVSKSEFQDSIKVLRDSIDSFTNRITAVENAVKTLTSDINSMITSIVTQAAESPVVGYLNTPFGVNAMMLAVYYGTPDEDWDFPSTKASNYFNGDITKWTERNAHIMGVNKLSQVEGYLKGSAKEMLVTQNNGQIAGNAGTLYVTVNPSNVDFTGKTLSLLDSKDQAAAATLEPLVRSDRQLGFGYTRAVENGFYEAPATITSSDVSNAVMKLDYNSIKEDAKALLKDKTRHNALELGATLLKNVTDVLPAYGVMGSWTDQSTNTVHKVYSEYNIGATALKPLSLAFLNDWKGVTKMPGFDRVTSLVDEIIDKINISVDVNFNLPDFTKYKGSIEFKDITLPTIDDDMFRITYYHKYTSDDLAGEGQLYGDTKNVDLYFLVTNVKDGRYALVGQSADGTTNKLFIYDPATKTYHEATPGEEAAWGAIKFEMVVDVDINKTPEIKSTLQDIINSLNSDFGANSSLAKNITDLLNDVSKLSDLEEDVNGSIQDAIISAKKDIKSQINKYISKANQTLTKWFNRAPGLMHLCMVVSSDKGTGLTSMSKRNPTKVSGAVRFVPTTYNLELIAPTYKKFVAVTDVFKADRTPVDEATAISMAAAVKGNNMGKVIDGNHICRMNAGQAGYIYEITYTAVDYFGKVAIRKYYVKF